MRDEPYVLVYSKSGQVDEPNVIDPNIDQSSKLYKPEIRNTIIKNGPKNPPVTVELPKGFPASFDSGVISRGDVDYPQYDRDLNVKGGRLMENVKATSGWSSRKILESFINNNFESVLDSKGQNTVFELTKTGAIEAIKKREQTKGHVVSVLRGFGTTNQMRLMLDKLGITFSYPKPVDLISYLIEAFSGPNDIVLDSFAGSGTTAHSVMKLNSEKVSNRRWILVELDASTARNVIVPRLKAVMEGHEAAKISACGGGFRYFRLAPSLLEKDKWGNWVVSKDYRPEMLAEAMCKLEGFHYAPNPEVFWIHGHSTEADHIYVTTQNLNHEQLRFLSDQVGSKRTLLICCGAFRAKKDEFPNLTMKKIPQAVLARCEWGQDDYSLNVENLSPVQEVEKAKTAEKTNAVEEKKINGRRKKGAIMQELPLFAYLEREKEKK